MPKQDIQNQTYDDHGDPICPTCGNPINYGDKYIQIRQQISPNYAGDDRLNTHLACLSAAMYPPDPDLFL